MEVRQLDDGSLHITGYVNITDRPSRVLRDNKGNSFVERVEPRCFTRALNTGANVKFLLNHNHDIHLGSLDEGNLKLVEDNIGLKIDATVNNAEVRKAYEEGGFSGFSYGFKKLKDNFRDWDNGVQLRTLQEIRLIEVSLLDSNTPPAYLGCMVNVEHRDGDATETEIRAFSNQLEEENTETHNQNSYELEEKRADMNTNKVDEIANSVESKINEGVNIITSYNIDTKTDANGKTFIEYSKELKVIEEVTEQRAEIDMSVIFDVQNFIKIRK